MKTASDHLRTLAVQVVGALLELSPLDAALLAGSAARGDADFYSDVDLLVYMTELPPVKHLDQLHVSVAGTNPIRFGDRDEGEDSIQFYLHGVATQVSITTVAHQEALLARLRDRPEQLDPLSQKVFAGLVEGIALRGEKLISRWQALARDYPDELQRATITQHWRVFPVWWYQDALAARDAELWRVELLLDAAFHLLGVLAALNRVYFSRFELKRLRTLTATFTVAPAQLSERIESLFSLAPAASADELGLLVEETRALVLSRLPNTDLPLARKPGTRIQPWQIRELD